MWNYKFEVPEQKKIRMLVHTDCANEADDQFALAHVLMTDMIEVKGVIAAHFNSNTVLENFPFRSGETASASYEEIKRILGLMGMKDKVPVSLGSGLPLSEDRIPETTDATQMIIKEALKDDERPLYIGCMGSLTDLAAAILLKPEICGRMTAIWIGGGDYPEGGMEFNLLQDIYAANVVFSSKMELWQIPKNVYKTLSVSLSELQYKVECCGDLGKYLFDYMTEYNSLLSFSKPWPHGEVWGLGDQGVIAVLLQEYERTDNYTYTIAPRIDKTTMHYLQCKEHREIRVYSSLDVRITLEDFFSKLAINFK